MATSLFRRLIKGTGGARLGSSTTYTDINTSGCIAQVGGVGADFGSATNNTMFSASGVQTMNGVARVYKEVFIPARSWYESGSVNHGLSGSKYMSVGNAHYHIPTWAASSTTCDLLLNTSFIAPLDAANSGSVLATVEYLVATQVTSSSNLGVKLHYNWLNDAASTTSNGSVQAAAGPSASRAANLRVSASLGNLASFDAGGQLCFLNAQFFTGVCGAGTNFQFLGLRLKYLADRLGTQSS